MPNPADHPPPRQIIHLDADAFYASVEQASDPRLRGRPIAVGGERRGVIASASYEARRFGIEAAMPTSRARRLCPNLIVLPGDFEKYERFSQWMFSYAYDFTPDVEITSVDEGYADLSATRKPALEIASTLREAIRASLKISVSEGVGTNKLISQVASKLRKPHALIHIPPGQELQFLHPLPNRWLPGVGPQLADRLNSAGLASIGQIANTPTDLLHRLCLTHAPLLKQFANAIDPRPVIAAATTAKSYSHQETFPEDQTDEPRIEATLRKMADQLFATVRSEQCAIRTLTVKIRYNDLDEHQVSESLAEPTDIETEIYPLLHTLLRRAWKRRVSLRRVGLKLANIYNLRFATPPPLELLPDDTRHHARQRLARAVDSLRVSLGPNTLLRGHDLLLRHPTPLTPTLQESPPAWNAASTTAAKHPTPAPPKTTHTHQPRPAQSYVPLGIHSHFSFLDSTLTVPDLIQLAVQHQIPALALTDTANLHAAIPFTQAATQAGLQPIIGTTLQWHGATLRLYVTNPTGYTNLCQLLSQPKLLQHLADPRPLQSPTWPESCPTDGLLAACTQPHPSLQHAFPQRLYHAIQNRQDLEAPNPHVPALAIPEIRHHTTADRWRFDILQSIRTLTLLNQEHPAKRRHGSWHFRPPQSLAQALQAHPRLLDHTRELAERCAGFRIPLSTPHFPAFTPPDTSTPRAFLRHLVLQGLHRRYPTHQARQLLPQIEEELRIIAAVGYDDYFLNVWQLLQDCRARGIDWITRGSAADSLTCYCLGISGVCPIRFKLYFRRFLNPERMALHKLPDIDIDFPHDRKDDVVQLVFQRHGPNHTAVVGGFSTYQARSAVADIAKVLGMSEFQVRRFTEHFPWHGSQNLVETLRANPKCRDLPLDEEPWRSTLAMATFLDGFPRHPKMHPCGIVLSRHPIHTLTPTFMSSKGWPTTHFDMDAVEAIGLVKIDILAQGGLAVIRDTLALLHQPATPQPPDPG